MKEIIFISIFITTIFCNANAQFGDVPPNAEAGKCYAKCYKDRTMKEVVLEWEEVLCQSDYSYKFVRLVNDALKSKGFESEDLPILSKKEEGKSFSFSAKTKEALAKFQKANGLPTGPFNIKTVKALGVEY